MNIDTNILVPMTEANQNFSKVVRLVDESGMAVILKNNKPRYMVLKFQEYDEIQAMRKKSFNNNVDSVISENVEVRQYNRAKETIKRAREKGRVLHVSEAFKKYHSDAE